MISYDYVYISKSSSVKNTLLAWNLFDFVCGKIWSSIGAPVSTVTICLSSTPVIWKILARSLEWANNRIVAWFSSMNSSIFAFLHYISFLHYAVSVLATTSRSVHKFIITDSTFISNILASQNWIEIFFRDLFSYHSI